MWNKIIGQQRVINQLTALYKSSRISHAFLFSGEAGVGKDAVAVEFAKLLNCTNVTDTQACDKCVNCKSISSLNHELLNFICALPSGRSDQSGSNPLESLSQSDYQNFLSELNKKSRNLYYRMSLANANNIRIDSIRELVRKIYLSSSAGTRRVFLISEAEKMKREAANALLKVLEEPPGSSILILTTSKPEQLPQTIIGRCQKISFETLPVDKIKENIIKESENNADYKFSNEEIELASSLSGGSYSRTLDLLNYGVKELRDTCLNFMISFLKKDYAELVSICRSVPSRSDKNKSRFFLYVLKIWFNDLLHVKNYSDNQKPLQISNTDLKERLITFRKNYPETDIFKIILQFEEAEKMLGQNVNPEFVLTNLAFHLKHFIK
jgi:DNA polymerase-3 subunit delta'